MKKDQGQSLIEFIIFVIPVVLMLVLVAKLFGSEWSRAQCAYLVFEKTHAKRIGKPNLQLPISVPFFLQNSLNVHIHVEEKKDRWRGIGKCGDVREEVDLPKLENAKW